MRDSFIAFCMSNSGFWAYFLVFLMILGQTGIIFLFFIPGNALLFGLGAMAARDDQIFDFWILLFIVAAAGVLGNCLNYKLGERYGVRLLSPSALEKVQLYFKKYGRQTIFLAPFIPNIRTWAPFFAGMTKSSFSQFQINCILGISSWAMIFLGLGFLFGEIPAVKDNFQFVILMMILIFAVPGIFQVLKTKG